MNKFGLVDLTYDDFNWSNVRCIQDPIYEAYIDFDNYMDIYDMLLASFDGSSDTAFITHFFTRSPLNSMILVFHDQKVRNEFAHLAMFHGLIPPLKEFHEGESQKEKQKRKEKPVLDTSQKAQLKVQQMMKSLDKLRAQLDNESDPVIIDRINKKIEKISDLVSNTV
jgi:hypothetical protein